MTHTMSLPSDPPAPTSTAPDSEMAVLEYHLRRCDRETLAALVADLWAARGYGTTREAGVVRAAHAGETVHVGVGAAAAASDEAVDVVVAPDGVAPDRDVRVVDAADLAELLAYAVDRPVARTLCERHLGASPAALPVPPLTRARRRTARVLDGATPVVAVTAVVLLAVAGVLAGAVPPGGDSGAADAGEADIVTPGTPDDRTVRADTDRSLPDVGPGPFPSEPSTPPPGVSEEGITDIDALATAHERAMANRSHTVWLDRSTRRLNGEDERLAHDIDMVTDGRRFLVTTTDVESDEGQRLETVYYDGVDAYRAEYDDATGEYGDVERADPRSVSPTPDSVRESLVWRYLAAENTTVTGTTVRGEPNVYRVVATGGTEARGFDHVWNYTAVAQVDARGFVHDLAVEFDARSGSRVFRVRHEITYHRVGSTEFEPPDWYRAGAVNATAS